MGDIRIPTDPFRIAERLKNMFEERRRHWHG